MTEARRHARLAAPTWREITVGTGVEIAPILFDAFLACQQSAVTVSGGWPVQWMTDDCREPRNIGWVGMFGDARQQRIAVGMRELGP